MKCGALFLYCASLFSVICGQVPVVQPGSAASFSVANGSDVTVQARCDNGLWTGIINVPTLLQYGASQQNGLLSSFPATQLNFTSLNCTASQNSSSVVFNRVNTFFFGGLPTYNASTSNLVSLCADAVPGIPWANVSVSVQSNYAYCKGETQRGRFRGNSIQIPDFAVQPQNISLANDTTVVSLSCGVTPGSSAQGAIQWFYQANATSPTTPLLNKSPTVFIESEVVSGASVLVLYNQSISLLPGLYFCQVSLIDQTLNSSKASVVFNGTYSIPPPPSRLQIAYGESGFITYVPANGSNITCSNYGNLSLTITNFTAYIIMPPVGEQNITCANYITSVMVTAPLGFTQSLGDYEKVVQQGSNVSLQCSTNSSSTDVQWLKDLMPLGSGNSWNISNVTRDHRGIYQCLAQCPNSSQSALVSSTYLNVYFFNSISITLPNGSSPVLNLSDPNTPPTLVLLCVVDAHPPPLILWWRGGKVWESGVVQVLANFTQPAMSQLSVSTSDLGCVEVFECGVTGAQNTSINITTYTVPNITLLVPTNITTTEGSTVFLSCEVRGQPLPNVTWNGTITGTTSVGGVVGCAVGGVATSNFTFVASRLQNGARFVCQAGGVVSPLVLLNVQATPGTSPDPITITLPNASSSNISWTPVAAFPSVTWYQLNVTLLPLGPATLMNTSSTTLLIQNLMPFRNYSVAVTPFNIIGWGPTAFGNWTTLEAAPNAPPQNVITSVTQIKNITVSWDPPPASNQNGVIIGYMVTWLSSSVGSVNVSTLTYTISGLNPATQYQIKVAARTGAGVSMFSPAVYASTFPELSTMNKLSAGPTTTTTITINITLPTSLVTFSHLWIIVMRLNDSLAQQINNGTFPPFTSNTTFVNYSTNVPAGSPYVAAELPGNVPSSLVYVLGNETQPNDAPTVHPNKGLTPGAFYTAFVWGFFNVTNGGASSKRQANANVRQYTAFSSSVYLTPLTTSSVYLTPLTTVVGTTSTGITAGQIAGSVIGSIVGVVVVVVALVLVVLYVLYQRQNAHKGYNLPPRKGSFRIPEASVKPPKSLPIPFNDLILENHQHLPLIVEQFANHVKQLHANSDHLFSEEYELFTIKSPNLPHVASCLPCNINKNRYANINSFDDTRVCLSVNPGIECSDYINANYIDGFQQKRVYIATQGPLPSTTYDFWKMVWEQNSCCIIMLTNLVEKTRAKCHQYWPEVGSIMLEDLVITLVETQELAYYTVRTFQMNKGEESYEVKQFHYTGWPDFGVPEMPHPLIAFIRRLENFKRTTDGPDIIHCSAGVGRTGTLIVIQELIKMADQEHKVDVFNFALELRKQRSYMIQTEHQYIFIHDTLLEVIRTGNTQTTSQRFHHKCKEMKELSTTEQCEVVQEFERAQELQVMKPSQFSSAKLPPNIPKNRTQSAIPYDLHRVRLLMQPGVNGSDYINASYVDGYERKQQYILTQGPMRNTVDDFWRMIWEHRVYTIVMLCCVEENGVEQCVQYWPTDNIKQYGDLFVQLNKENRSSIFCRELTITNTKINESRSLKLYQYTDWEENVSPADCADLLGLLATVHKPQQHHNGPIVIHDGITLGRSGSFAVISASIEQLKAEGVVDIMFTMLSMRQQLSGIVPTLDYYQLCYRAVAEYLNSFQQYSNFD